MYTCTYIYKIYNYGGGKKKKDTVNYTQGACTRRPGLCHDLSVCKKKKKKVHVWYDTIRQKHVPARQTAKAARQHF